MNKAALILTGGASHAWLRALSFVLLLVIWEVAAVAAHSRVLPEPWQVAISFWDHLVNGSLLSDLGITLWRVIDRKSVV